MSKPRRALRDAKCLITGAASGIGKATALAASEQGAQLVLTDLRADQLEQTVRELRASGGRVLLAEAFDISDFDAVRAFSERCQRELGSMDIVMNVAGISIWGAVDKLEHRHWRKCIEVNLMGPIHVIECFIPEMIKTGRGGHLVNVSSAAGLFGLPWHAAYSATKFGLRGVSEVLRFDLARHGIGVSLVCPGGVDTQLVQTVEIVGLERSNTQVAKLQSAFRKHAVTPEHAARAILRGIEQNEYMVFTSRDIRIGYWLQRKFELPYAWAMRLLNDRLHSASLSSSER